MAHRDKQPATFRPGGSRELINQRNWPGSAHPTQFERRRRLVNSARLGGEGAPRPRCLESQGGLGKISCQVRRAKIKPAEKSCYPYRLGVETDRRSFFP
jgi:hypothetical protein